MSLKTQMENRQACCHKNKENKTGFLRGLIYGLIPHLGCIAFIVFSVLGATTATALFKPLLLNPYFFHLLIVISIIFATISALFHFKRQGFVNGKYLLTLYGTTIIVNLFLFMIVFPMAANLQQESNLGAAASNLSLQVDIPCPGHAPLIIGELKSINGVDNVKFGFPNLFDVSYDSQKTSKEQILSLTVFKTYQADVLSEGSGEKVVGESDEPQLSKNPVGCCGSAGSSGCGCGCGR